MIPGLPHRGFRLTTRSPKQSQFVGWLLACLTSRNMLVYLRDGSAQTSVRAATPKKKLQIQLSVSLTGLKSGAWSCKSCTGFASVLCRVSHFHNLSSVFYSCFCQCLSFFPVSVFFRPIHLYVSQKPSLEAVSKNVKLSCSANEFSKEGCASQTQSL